MEGTWTGVDSGTTNSGMEVWDSDSSGMEVWEPDTSGLIVLISETCLPSKPSQRLLVVSPGVMLTGWDRSSPIICPRDRFWVNVCCISTLGHSFLEACLEPGVCHIAVEASEVIDTSG